MQSRLVDPHSSMSSRWQGKEAHRDSLVVFLIHALCLDLPRWGRGYIQPPESPSVKFSDVGDSLLLRRPNVVQCRNSRNFRHCTLVAWRSLSGGYRDEDRKHTFHLERFLCLGSQVLFQRWSHLHANAHKSIRRVISPHRPLGIISGKDSKGRDIIAIDAQCKGFAECVL